MDLHYHYDYFNDDDVQRDRDVEREHQRRVNIQVNLRFWLRDVMNPFDISVTEFIRLYRIPQHLVMRLTQIIKPYMPMRVGEKQIPLEMKVLCALQFFASGSYQRVIGRSADLSISQATVSNIIRDITEVLNHPALLTRFIHFPFNRREREEIIERNAALGLPRVLGLIDSTYVKIVPPPLNEFRAACFCRKGYTALNVQIVCDASLYILDINARFPGGCNDPFIYWQSGVREEMQRAYRGSRCWLLGDSAYPFEPWLHVPLPHAERGTPEYDYTKLHCQSRNPVGRVNGNLKGRWRCLLNDRTLHCRPEKAGLIVNACAVLHNFCVSNNLPVPHPRHCHDVEGNGRDNEEDGDEDDDEVLDGNFRLRQRALEERRFLVDYAHQAVRGRQL